MFQRDVVKVGIGQAELDKRKRISSFCPGRRNEFDEYRCNAKSLSSFRKIHSVLDMRNG